MRHGTLKLVASEGEYGEYNALSYRWGPHEQSFLMTAAEMSNFMLGIDWSRLPKVFQDAITVTRWLGIAYIWIDAFCIIQGDRQGTLIG